MPLLASLAALVTLWTTVGAHSVLTYPIWRGNNLRDSGRTTDDLIPVNGLGVAYDNNTQSLTYPYGMQWVYPCKSPWQKLVKINMLMWKQAEVCRHPPTEPSGPLTEVPFPFNQVGSLVISMHSSTSTLDLALYHKTCRFPWFLLNPSLTSLSSLQCKSWDVFQF